MKYRKTSIYEQTDASTAKTETIDLALSEIISRLQIKFNSTNNGHTPTNHPAKQISKVELVDGSDVLFSLSAQQIEALMFYEYGVGRNYEIEYRNDCENRMVLDILFGRKLWDTDLALDPKKFKNPQLKITHNKALGGSAPDAATLEVFADVFDEKAVSPMGFLMMKELKSYDTGASAANEYTDLPNDFPIRRILLQAYKADAWWDNIFTEIELDEENKRRLPWSLDAYDLMQLAITKYGQYHETLVGTTPSIGTDKVYYITPVEAANVAMCVMGDPSNAYLQGERSGGYIDVEVVAIQAFRALVSGIIPHGVIPLDCGDLMDPADWFDVTTKGKIKLRLKAMGSTTVYIALQQLRKYA
jgi:hypothetical protein